VVSLVTPVRPADQSTLTFVVRLSTSQPVASEKMDRIFHYDTAPREMFRSTRHRGLDGRQMTAL
jgi:hypothetical protein